MTCWQGWWRRRRLVFSLGLSLIVPAFVVATLRAWGEPVSLTTAFQAQPPKPQTHASYLFLLALPYGDLHAGEPVRVHWMPELLDSLSPTPATSVVCNLALYGPYSSTGDLDQALHVDGVGNADPSQWPTPAFIPPTLRISDQTNAPQVTEVLLPTTLLAGFYAVASKSIRGWDQTTSQSFAVVRVVGSHATSSQPGAGVARLMR